MTDARPNSPEEEALQKIQFELSGGVDILSSEPDIAHLSLYEEAVVNAPSRTAISLWVPADQRSNAEALLENAGFTVSQAASQAG